MKTCKQCCRLAGTRYIVLCPNENTRPFDLISNDGIKDVGSKLKNKNGICIGGDLLFCLECAKALVEADKETSTNTNEKRLLSGHVSGMTGTKYKKYVAYSKQLHRDGYLQINKNECFIFKEFPPAYEWEDLLKAVICDVQTKRFQTLFSEKKGAQTNPKYRMWCDLLSIKGNAKESHARYSGNGEAPKYR